jgi:hypothetical protein
MISGMGRELGGSLAKDRGFADSLLEGAVSSELVSESKFPGYWERYREFRLNPDPTADKHQPNQSLTTSIPW